MIWGICGLLGFGLGCKVCRIRLGLTFAFSKGLLAFSLYLAFRRENWRERERETESETLHRCSDMLLEESLY
jgi:hypothetical protein